MWLAEVVCVPSVAYLMVYLLATAESQSQAGYNCFNSTGIQGNCIAISLCPEIMAMTTHKPRIPEEVKFMKKSLCGFERNQPKVCCPDSMVDRTTEFYDKGGSINLIPDQKGCGKYREEEAFGDSTTTADFRDFPWMALLLYNNTLGILNDLYCAGVLISNRYVLTAANCIRGQRVTKTYLQLTGVRLGEWSTETNPDCRFGECAPEYQDIPVESTVVHSNYNPENPNQRDDIALLRLSRDVVYSDWIGAVCLPLISSGVTQKNRVGNFLVLSGWDKIDEISAFDVKQKTLVSVFPPANCISVYEKVQGVSFSPSQICAGGKGEVIADPFRGEGGNPLLSLEYEWDKVNWYVAAIVSFRPSSCYAEACPGIYTDVSKYDTWILRNIKP